MKLSVLPIWVKLVAALALCAALLWLGWQVRGWHDDSQALKQARADKQAVLDAIAQNGKDNAKENQAIRKLLTPKVGSKVNDAVAANPSPCRVPAPVRDALHDGVGRANSAIRDSGDVP